MKATDVTSVATYRPDAAAKIRELETHYPTATWVYRQAFDLEGKTLRLYSQAELIELSKQLQTSSVEELRQTFSVRE